MLYILYIGVAAAFFAASIVYLYACGRL